MIKFDIKISDDDLSILLSYYDEFEEVITEKVEWLLDNIVWQEGYHEPDILTEKEKYKIAKKNRDYKKGKIKTNKVKKDKEKEKKVKPPSDEAWRLK
jgi:hypothetical protein